MGWNTTAITVVGVVASEVTHRELALGYSRATFRVLSVERRYDAEKKDFVDGDKLFLNVTCWRRLADEVGKALAKGDSVIVTGKLRNRDYELDGERRKVSEIEAVAVGANLQWGRVVVEHSRTGTADVPIPGLPDVVAPRKEGEGVPEVVAVPF
ncbi:single-stranded DNA-binding protein [Umezawaea endophytica]|uniref:Single-stranded DNA-binding protein n=1 Tax=Umezawaea endophytica TaxID=1654476 RepID=A0A9X2VGG6_9PSEU|nr:single-stranded DNA-binding protein [Umezawaea endophytica]MCS7476180.1 single-stranded DNA-binding protein [Umezawaea endophytica]